MVVKDKTWLANAIKDKWQLKLRIDLNCPEKCCKLTKTKTNYLCMCKMWKSAKNDKLDWPIAIIDNSFGPLQMRTTWPAQWWLRTKLDWPMRSRTHDNWHLDKTDKNLSNKWKRSQYSMINNYFLFDPNNSILINFPFWFFPEKNGWQYLLKHENFLNICPRSSSAVVILLLGSGSAWSDIGGVTLELVPAPPP